MTITISKGADKATIENALAQLQKQTETKNGVDTRKYCGVIELKENPLLMQKQLRDEWE